jgi:exonuclease III
MRIVAWNIRAGGGRRVDGILEQLARWDADVIALSEHRATPPGRRLVAGLADAGLIHQRETVDLARPAENALLVASRWPLRRAALRGLEAEPRRWLPVRVEAPADRGGGITLGALHIPNYVTGRERKAGFHAALLALARRWRGGPALLAGDTNTGRIGLDEETPVFDAHHDGWMTAMAAAGWADAFRLQYPAAREFTWYSPNAGNGFRLDQAFINRPLLPRLAAVEHRWGRLAAGDARATLSDHAALVIDFE